MLRLDTVSGLDPMSTSRKGWPHSPVSCLCPQLIQFPGHCWLSLQSGYTAGSCPACVCPGLQVLFHWSTPIQAGSSLCVLTLVLPAQGQHSSLSMQKCMRFLVDFFSFFFFFFWEKMVSLLSDTVWRQIAYMPTKWPNIDSCVIWIAIP